MSVKETERQTGKVNKRLNERHYCERARERERERKRKREGKRRSVEIKRGDTYCEWQETETRTEALHHAKQRLLRLHNLLPGPRHTLAVCPRYTKHTLA